MPAFDTTLAFFAVALLIAMTPGPDNLFVLIVAATKGRRSGILVVLGLCTGLVVHTLAVAFGLAALFAVSALAFTVLKFVGAAYLLYLAWQAWRAPVHANAGCGVPVETRTVAWRLFARGVVTDLTNPKVVLFFIAFLPQFVRPEAGPVAAQLVWFGLEFIVATLIVFTCIANLAGYIGDTLRKSARAQQSLNRVAACVLGGLALKLATSRRS